MKVTMTYEGDQVTVLAEFPAGTGVAVVEQIAGLVKAMMGTAAPKPRVLHAERPRITATAEPSKSPRSLAGLKVPKRKEVEADAKEEEDDLDEIYKSPLRKAIDSAKGKPGRQPKESSGEGNSSIDPFAWTDTARAHRRKIAIALLDGPKKPMQIVDGAGVPMGSITSLLDCLWFRRCNEGVHLTTDGRKAAMEAQGKKE